MDTVTSILIQVLRKGNIIRITEKETNTKFVATVENKSTKTDTINILTNKTNFIGDIFAIRKKEKEFINLKHYDISTIPIKEYTILKNTIIESMNNEINKEVKKAYNKILYKIDEIVENSKDITTNLIKIGYRMYPQRKIEIFNTILLNNNYINENIPSTFTALNLLLSFTKN